jgi:hypothetical protein
LAEIAEKLARLARSRNSDRAIGNPPLNPFNDDVGRDQRDNSPLQVATSVAVSQWSHSLPFSAGFGVINHHIAASAGAPDSQQQPGAFVLTAKLQGVIGVGHLATVHFNNYIAGS